MVVKDAGRFGRLLRAYRCDAGMTQEDLRVRAELTTSALSKLERGLVQPRRATAERLANALELPPDDRDNLLGAGRIVRRATGRARTARSADRPLDAVLAPPTAVFGRGREVGEVRVLLADPQVRVLTLTGPGGVGKTRLALRVVDELRALDPAGVCVVSLAAVRDGADVLGTLARTLGLSEANPRPLHERLVTHLHGRSMVILLDNFEHVLAAAPEVADLVARCPRLRLLVTSRSLLHVSGEHDFAVSPLAVPTPEVVRVDQATIADYPAIRLFVERTRAVRPGFMLTSGNAAVVADICRWLDGLPLAIELAAARGALLGPAALLERLDCRLDVLTIGPRDAPLRLQTLRAAIGWSYDLLDPDEQALFRALSVFRGGCTLEAAVAVCGGAVDTQQDQQVVDGIGLLVDKSLVYVFEDASDDVRVGILETIREYGQERLVADGATDVVSEAHARYFVTLAADAYDAMYQSDADAWLARLRREHDNLQEALAWLADRGEMGRALQLAGALYRFWLSIGYVEHGLRWLDQLLEHPDNAAASRARARALAGAGVLAGERGDLGAASARFDAAADLYQLYGDDDSLAIVRGNQANVAALRGAHDEVKALLEPVITYFRKGNTLGPLANALGNMGNSAIELGKYAEARRCLEESLALAQTLNCTPEVCDTTLDLGRVAYEEGNYEEARRAFEASLEQARVQGYHRLSAYALILMGRLAVRQRNPERAVGVADEAVAIARQSCSLYRVSQALIVWADALRACGRDEEARARYGEGLQMACRRGLKVEFGYALQGLAAIATAQGEPERATRLWGAARQALGETGQIDADDMVLVNVARTTLGKDHFAALWDEGASLSEEAITTYAVGG